MEVLKPTVEVLRYFKKPAYRLLQAIPLFFLCSCVTWIGSCVKYGIDHPEFGVDLVWSALETMPSYFAYAAPRVMRRFLYRAGGVNVTAAGDDNSYEPVEGWPWWNTGIPIFLFCWRRRA